MDCLLRCFFFFFRNKSVTVVTEDTVVYTDIRSSILDQKKSQLTQQADKKGKGRKKSPGAREEHHQSMRFFLHPHACFLFHIFYPASTNRSSSWSRSRERRYTRTHTHTHDHHWVSDPSFTEQLSPLRSPFTCGRSTKQSLEVKSYAFREFHALSKKKSKWKKRKRQKKKKA